MKRLIRLLGVREPTIHIFCWLAMVSPPLNARLLVIIAPVDKTIKLWKVKERQIQTVVENNKTVAQKLISTDVRLPLMLPKLREKEPIIAAFPRRIFSNAHTYHIHSISMNSDEETFLSADDLRVNLWNLNYSEESFNVVDLKPPSIEDLTEVITSTKFHPQHCNLFAYATSKGIVNLVDMRAAAICDRSARIFKREAGETGNMTFFTELISSISDLSFNPDGKHLVTRDYMNLKVWDLAQEREPLMTIPVHNGIRPKLCDLYENDSIFDRFECSYNYDGSTIMSGSYSNYLRMNSIKDNSIFELIQADKSIFKSRKSSKSRLNLGIGNNGNNTSSSSLSSLRSPPLMASNTPCKLDDVKMASDLDFDKKIIHASMHPRENTVAIAASSNLFIFSQS